MPIGIYGTLPHILTNRKLDNKKATYKDCITEGVNGTGKILIANSALITAGSACAVTAERLFPKQINNIKTNISNKLNNINISFAEGSTATLKDILNSMEVVKSIKKLPASLKGTLAAIALMPFVTIYMLKKTKGNIAAAEAKHEIK